MNLKDLNPNLLPLHFIIISYLNALQIYIFKNILNYWCWVCLPPCLSYLCQNCCRRLLGVEIATCNISNKCLDALAQYFLFTNLAMILIRLKINKLNPFGPATILHALHAAYTKGFNCSHCSQCHQLKALLHVLR